MLDFLVVFLRQFIVYYGVLEQEFLLMVVCCYLVEWGSFWVGNHSRHVSIMPRYVFFKFDALAGSCSSGEVFVMVCNS